MNTIIRSAAVVLLLAASASAGVPNGSFKGATPKLADPDVMAFIVRGDYAVLMEYTRQKWIPGPERIELTKWVPRTYVFKLEPNGDKRYSVRPIRVSASGELVADPAYPVANSLVLKKDGKMDGAVLTRYDKGSVLAAETITFDGKLSSTWENYVPGDYFWSKDPTGGDYFHKAVNTKLSKDKVASFDLEDIQGRYDMTEKAPGLFTFTAKAADQKGAAKVLPRIAVFIDIVNWKPFMTTDELLTINPDDAKDVGFYYERH
jgi:hypothetical protein